MGGLTTSSFRPLRSLSSPHHSVTQHFLADAPASRVPGHWEGRHPEECLTEVDCIDFGLSLRETPLSLNCTVSPYLPVRVFLSGTPPAKPGKMTRGLVDFSGSGFGPPLLRNLRVTYVTYA